MLPLSFQNFLLQKVLVGKGFRRTLRADDAVQGAKERFPRKEEEREGKRRRRRKEGIGYSIDDFLPTANNYDTHCIVPML